MYFSLSCSWTPYFDTNPPGLWHQAWVGDKRSPGKPLQHASREEPTVGQLVFSMFSSSKAGKKVSRYFCYRFIDCFCCGTTFDPWWNRQCCCFSLASLKPKIKRQASFFLWSYQTILPKLPLVWSGLQGGSWIIENRAVRIWGNLRRPWTVGVSALQEPPMKGQHLQGPA